MRWAEVGMRWATPPDLAPSVDPTKVAVLVAPTMARADWWCREHGLPSPTRRPRHDTKPIVVTNMDNAQRIRGMTFEPDAEMLVLDGMTCGSQLIEEVERYFETGKVRYHTAGSTTL